MNEVNIYIETTDENVIIPEYANIGDAGMDLRANITLGVRPGETVIVPTGIKVAIPEGYEIQIRPRSGLSYKTALRIANAPGTIDSGYRGEIGVIITNITDKNEDIKPIIISKGDRIAQMILTDIYAIKWIPTDNVKDIGKDRKGGFGSTGIK